MRDEEVTNWQHDANFAVVYVVSTYDAATIRVAGRRVTTGSWPGRGSGTGRPDALPGNASSTGRTDGRYRCVHRRTRRTARARLRRRARSNRARRRRPRARSRTGTAAPPGAGGQWRCRAAWSAHPGRTRSRRWCCSSALEWAPKAVAGVPAPRRPPHQGG
jgi:hypothetical protein